MTDPQGEERLAVAGVPGPLEVLDLVLPEGLEGFNVPLMPLGADGRSCAARAAFGAFPAAASPDPREVDAEVESSLAGALDAAEQVG